MTITLNLWQVGIIILLLNAVIYAIVNPLTFLGADMRGWNKFHIIMLTIGICMIIIGIVRK